MINEEALFVAEKYIRQIVILEEELEELEADVVELKKTKKVMTEAVETLAKETRLLKEHVGYFEKQVKELKTINDKMIQDKDKAILFMFLNVLCKYCDMSKNRIAIIKAIRSVYLDMSLHQAKQVMDEAVKNLSSEG